MGELSGIIIQAGGLLMATGFDQIHHNQPLQTHWANRFIAILIDGIIITIPTVIIWTLIGGFWLSMLLFGILWICYGTVFELAKGATIGKMILGLEVVSVSAYPEPAYIFVRNLSKIHVIVLLVDWLVGMASKGDPRQKFTDKIVKTTVIQTDLITFPHTHAYHMMHRLQTGKTCMACGTPLINTPDGKYQCPKCGLLH